MTVLTCEDCGAPHNDHEVRSLNSRRVEAQRDVEGAVERETQWLEAAGDLRLWTCAVEANSARDPDGSLSSEV
jgi:hypothetical protein